MKIRMLLIAAGLASLACDGATPVAVHNDRASALLVSSSALHGIPVPAPTGIPEEDVANIRIALAQATSGSVVRFAAGTYALGLNEEHFVVTAPGVSLAGHPDGTTLEGTEVLGFDVPVVFHLIGGGQSVRGLTFRKVGEAIRVGFTNPDRGGYVIEGCTFEYSINPLWMGLDSRDVTRIAHNLFVNTAIPSWTDGMTTHFIGNTMLTPDPAAVPLFGQPLFTDIIESGPRPWSFPLAANNLVADNRAVGFPDGTHIASHGDGVTRNNIVRNNTYQDQRAYSPGDLGTMVVVQGWDAESTTDGNLIEGNSLLGSEGIGVYIWGSTGTRVLHNTIHDVRDNPTSGIPGMGVAVAASAPGQQIVGNDFAGNARYDVRLRSDNNLVVLREAGDVVSDLGQNNRIVGGGSAMRTATVAEFRGADGEATRQKAEAMYRWRKAPRR